MTQPRAIQFQLNGREVSAEARPGLTLVRYLRDHLHLTGTKVGCTPGDGDCGVCTVLIDGKRELACLTPLAGVAGRSVVTIEGLAGSNGALEPVQEAYVRSGAIQCGFCIPAYILATRELLARNPNPSEDEIKEGLDGILCRCTGYTKVIQAVQGAAAYLQGGRWPDWLGRASIDDRNARSVGRSPIKVDAVAKATGKEAFTDDLYLPNMLHGKLLFADRPSARIARLDTSRAEQAPGVAAVLTARDVKGTNRMGVAIRDKPIFADGKVRSVVDVIAAVFAETGEQAAEALKLVDVVYENLPGVFSIEEAAAPGAPIVHEHWPTGNVLKEANIEVGDVDRAFAEAHLIVENDYYIPWIDHGFIEPESGVAYVDERGVVTLRIASQCLFMDRDDLVQATGIPKENFREIVGAVGGAFGGKEDLSLHPYLALGALKTGRPVKITANRAESFLLHHRKHMNRLHYKTAVDKEGNLMASEVRIEADGGAYAHTSPYVISQGTMFSSGPYNTPNLRLRGIRYYTNNLPCGSFRGFGINQPVFAMESQLDVIARELKMDPFELRLKNAMHQGDKTPSGVTLDCTVGVQQCLEAVREAARKAPPVSPRRGGKIGFGIAAAYKNTGVGQGRPDRAGCITELLDDGSIRIRTGAADVGGGEHTVLTQIAAEALGVAYEAIQLMGPDTELTPDCGRTAGSRQTYTSGNATYGACKQFREKLLDFVSQQYEISPDDVILEDGRTLWSKDGKQIATTEEVADRATAAGVDLTVHYVFNPPPTYPPVKDPRQELGIDPKDYRNYPAYSFVAHGAIVEVIEETGEVDVRRVYAAADCGKAIYPLGMEGQIEGSVVQGMGYALSEEYAMERGIPRTKTLSQLGIPGIKPTPEIVPLIVEDPEVTGPYGAKGMAEASALPGAPSIVNAIYDAVGVRCHDLPVRPEALKALIQEKQTREAARA